MITVAIVDNDAVVAAHLTQLLTGSGSACTVVAAARTVDELLGGPGRAAQVVVLDALLDDSSSAVDNVRRLTDAGAAVLLTSRHTTHRAVIEALRHGQGTFLSKENACDAYKLVNAVMHTADGTGQLPPELASAVLARDRGSAKLTPRQRQVYTLAATGLKVSQIADQLHLGPDWVKDCLACARKRLAEAGREVSNPVDMYKTALEEGMLGEPDD